MKATIAVLLALILLAPRGAAAQEINPRMPSGSVYWIANPIRVNLGFTDQNGKPSAAEVSSFSAAQLAGLPAGLLQAKGSELLTPGHFDALWSAMKDGICSDVKQAISTLENHGPNSPYDIQPSAMNPKGYLTANFQESWEDDSMKMVNGRRIRFTCQAPLNGVTFWMTSPHTCNRHSNCPTEPADPAFTIVFTAFLTVTCTSTPNATSFDLPVACTPAVDLSVDGVYGGDVTGQIIGHNTVGASGGQFLTNVLIPATTAPGAHLLHAGTPGSQPATASITVCQVGGCGPTVGVVNTSNNTLYPPGSVVEVGLPVVLRGSKFAPGGSVWIWEDSVQGTKAGTAPVFPPQDSVSASVAVYVQAQAQ